MSSYEEDEESDEAFEYSSWLGKDNLDDLVKKAQTPFNTTMRLAGDHNMDAADEARLGLHNIKDHSSQGLWRKYDVRSAPDVQRPIRPNNMHHRLPTPIEECLKARNSVFKEFKPVRTKVERNPHEVLVT